jgi:hypothetical protein
MPIRAPRGDAICAVSLLEICASNPPARRNFVLSLLAVR